MRTFRFKSYAKINLSIDVTCRRSDGYHDLKSIMQSVSLYDIITLKVGEAGIKITNSLPFLPSNRIQEPLRDLKLHIPLHPEADF